MKTCSRCKVPKETKEFNKNRAQKTGLDNQCTLCARKSKAKYKKENPEKHAAHQRKSYAKNPQVWQCRIKKWKLANPAKAALQASRRYEAEVARTPDWLTETNYDQMNLFYNAAKSLTKELGIKFEVDHIVPLQGRNVSGLNVPWNLQVLPKSINASKGNR